MPPEATAAPAAPAAPVIEPKPKLPNESSAAAAPATPSAGAAPASDAVVDPYEFELDVKGNKQKLKFADKNQLMAVLQKALYADQIIKDASQAKKGAEALMEKIKTRQGLREVLSDKAIGVDIKQWALEEVRELMEEEKLSPEQKELRDLQNYKKTKEEEVIRAKAEAATKAQQQETMKLAQEARTGIIDAMKKFPDIPQTQATMDAVIQNMRAGFRRFGKHLTAEQAMSVYSQQYWSSLTRVLETMTPEQMLVRFGQKTLDKIQQFKLAELRKKTAPGTKPPSANGESAPKKKHLTEKEFEKHFQELAGGL